jgi:predicted transcriptional regulator
MKFNKIEYKKPFFPVKAHLRQHLKRYSRQVILPFTYQDLTRYNDLIPIRDEDGNETLWYSVLYAPSESTAIQNDLIRGYQLLVGSGARTSHLMIESVQYCSFGNSKPFRIKVVNEINDNHDYYYVKQADASRIYGLELEEIFSPDKVSFLVGGDTLIEEHIVGIPCDEFIRKNKEVKIENRLRFAKEFVKFNERCFTRLLGDMRAYNFVVEITQDFDNVQYRLRAIDFDQQSYEGRKTIYLPQYYKDNIELVNLASELLSPAVAGQYQREEREAMKKRYMANRRRTGSLISRMRRDSISTEENVRTLAKELAKHHGDNGFLEFDNMADILVKHLEHQLSV